MTSPALERAVFHAVEDLRHEVLLERFPVVVDGRTLEHVKRLRLLNFSLDDDTLGDAIDLLAAGTAGDLDAGRLLFFGAAGLALALLGALVLGQCDRRS